MFEEVASAFVERRAFEAALAETEMHRAANVALESQLGQAHADLLLAQADAETLAVAVRAWASSHQPMECEECEDLVTLARTAHPGTPLADEVAAARAEIAYLREWIRSECLIADADINEAMVADVAKAARRKAKADADAETALLAAVAAGEKELQ